MQITVDSERRVELCRSPLKISRCNSLEGVWHELEIRNPNTRVSTYLPFGPFTLLRFPYRRLPVPVEGRPEFKWDGMSVNGGDRDSIPG